MEFFSEAYLGEVNENIIVEAGNTKTFSRNGRVAHIILLWICEEKVIFA